MRNLRAITLRDDALVPKGDPAEFNTITSRETRSGIVITVHRWREGDTLNCKRTCEYQTDNFKRGIHRVKTDEWSRSALIDYNKILAECKVVPDDDCYEMPWERCEGFEHIFESETEFENRFFSNYGIDAIYCSEMFTYQRGYVYRRGYDESGVIIIDDRYKNGQAVYDNYRRNGAAKQVAAELLAQWKQDYIDQIKKWYTTDQCYYGVTCEFTTGTDDYEESLWGIDDEDYATNEVVHEIASQVAYVAEKDGYIICNEPARQVAYKSNRRRMLKHRMNQFNWR